MTAACVVELLAVALEQHLREAINADQRRAQIVSDRIRKSLELPVQHIQLDRAPVQLAGALRHLLLQGVDQLDGLDGDGGTVRQRLQQLDFFVAGPMGPGPVHADRPDGRERPDGHHDETLNKRRAVGVRDDAGVLVDILDHRRLPIQHRPAAHARVQGKRRPFHSGPIASSSA